MKEESNELLCLLTNPPPPFDVTLTVSPPPPPPHHVSFLSLFVGFQILPLLDLSNIILSQKTSPLSFLR
ncbi:hypothetical protein Bca4012_058334 [Brassica carinata]